MTELESESFGITFDPYGELQPKQSEFLECGSKYKIMGGASGGGKSFGCRAEGFRSSMVMPGIKGLVLRRSRGEAIKNFVEPMLDETRIMQDDGTSASYIRWVPSRNTIFFPNGSEIEIGYCESESDIERWRGIAKDWACIEELTQWKEMWFRKLMACLRTTKPGIRPFFFGSCNPGGIGHSWVKRLFISRMFLENEDPNDYGTVRANLWDNPKLMEADPEYMQNLMGLPEKERRARLYGDWDVFEGQYFNEFREAIHVCDPFYPIGLVRRIIAIDYGYHPAPSCVLWMGIDTQGRIIVYREMYATRLSYAELALRIRALTREDENISCIVVDPAAIDKETEGTRTSLRKEFVKAKLPVVIPGKNSRVEGWRTVRRQMQAYKDPNTLEVTSNLLIGRNCSNLCRTFPDQVHDERDPEDMNSKGEDHPLDALRYGVMELSVNISSLSTVEKANSMLEKGAPPSSGLSAKTLEYLKRGGHSGGNILNQEF